MRYTRAQRSALGFPLLRRVFRALVEAATAREDTMCGITEAGKFWWEVLLLYTVVRSGDSD